MNSIKYIIDVHNQKIFWDELKDLLYPYRDLMVINKICCEDYFKNVYGGEKDLYTEFKWEYSEDEFRMSPLNTDEAFMINILFRMHKNWVMYWHTSSTELRGVLRYYNGGPLKQELIRAAKKLQLNNSYMLGDHLQIADSMMIHSYEDMILCLGLWCRETNKSDLWLRKKDEKDDSKNQKELCLLKVLLTTPNLHIF